MADPEPSDPGDEHEEVLRLRQENARLRREREADQAALSSAHALLGRRVPTS